MSNEFTELFQEQRSHFLSVVKHASLAERRKKLLAIKKWIRQNEDHIISTIEADFSKSPEEIKFGEIKPVLSEINEALINLKKWSRRKKVSTPLYLLGTHAEVITEPKGVVLIIAPWNFPFNLSIGPLVSALAAGNSVTLKPSEMTPFTEKLIVQMLGELFVKNEVAVVTGDAEVGAALLEQPWNHIFFTGSPQVGKLVMEAASKNLSSVTLELGGRNPAIVDSTANVKDSAEKLIWGKCFNAGQSCVSPNYLLVHSSKYDDLLKELKIACEKIFGSDNSDLNGIQALARIVNNKHYNRIKSLVDASVAEGAEVFMGGKFIDSDNYISPTVLTNVTPESVIFQEEIFGPILPIMKYDNWPEVFEIINSGEIPLALYVFSRSNKNIKTVFQNTSAGTSCVNDTTVQFIHPELPFGGHNFSGIGKAHGKYGFLEFSNERSVVRQRVGFTTAKMIYPPYTKLKRKIIHFLTWRL